jgi:hypothetical protein
LETPVILTNRLRRCRIFYVQSGSAVTWWWKSGDDHVNSTRLFPYFYECVEDARQNGYYVDFDTTPQHQPYPSTRPERAEVIQ